MPRVLRTSLIFAAFPFVGVFLSYVFGVLFTQGALDGLHIYYTPRILIFYAAYQAPFSAMFAALLTKAFESSAPENPSFSGFRVGIIVAVLSGAAAVVVIELNRYPEPSLSSGASAMFFIYVCLGLHLFVGGVAGAIAARN